MGFNVAIIGVGHVGADLAHALVMQGVADHIVLLDADQQKATGEWHDLQDMAALQHSDSQLSVGDYPDIADADVVVIAIGPQHRQQQDRLQELADTAQAVARIVPRLLEVGFNGIIVNITNPCDVISGWIQQLSGFPSQRVIGTGTLLDTARMQRRVGQQLSVSAKSVAGYVLGEHGESQFIAWSTVRIAGLAIEHYPSAVAIDYQQLQQQVRAGGWQVLQGKGWTSFAIASAASLVLQVIRQDGRRILPLSSYDAEQGCYIGAPTLLGRQGVIQRQLPQLTDQEYQLYQQSAQVIKQAAATINH